MKSDGQTDLHMNSMKFKFIFCYRNDKLINHGFATDKFIYWFNLETKKPQIYYYNTIYCRAFSYENVDAMIASAWLPQLNERHEIIEVK